MTTDAHLLAAGDGAASDDRTAADTVAPMSEVAEAVSQLRQAADLAQARLPADVVGLAQQIVDKADGRLRHGSNHTLVALLGATGGGKSSLTNAMTGADVATTGVRRPTTSSTMACHWGDDDPSALLDWLRIANRHQVGPEAIGAGSSVDSEGDSDSDGDSEGVDLDGLILLDVPDHDSVREAHRIEMERMAEHADLLVWVTDPEKYGDAALHSYLRVLHRHGAVMAIVLNKTDLLAPGEAGHCVADLRLLLQDVGLRDTPVVTAAAGVEPPDVGAVAALVAEAVTSRRAMTDRIAADVVHGAGELLDALGPVADDGTLDATVGDNLTEALVAASGLDPVLDAVEAGHVRDAATKTGWPVTRWVRRIRPHPLRRLRLQEGTAGRSSRPKPSGIHRTRAEAAVKRAVGEATTGLAQPWPEVVAREVAVDHDVLADRLDQAVTGATRDEGQRQPGWWGLVNVVQLATAAAFLAGLAWLAVLAGVAYLRLPDVPTPALGPLPLPTVLTLGGLALGLLVAMLARRLAAVGARRRRRAVRAEAVNRARAVSEDLVLVPLARELDLRLELHRLLHGLSEPDKDR